MTDGRMRFEKFINEGNNTKPTTFYHEVCCSIFSVNPSASLNTGSDILQYFVNGSVQAKNPSLSTIKPSELVTSTYGSFFTDEPIPSSAKKVIDDAKKLSVGLVSVLKKP